LLGLQHLPTLGQRGGVRHALQLFSSNNRSTSDSAKFKDTLSTTDIFSQQML
jgi:hypothetical protein